MAIAEVLTQPAIRSFVGAQEGKLRAVLRPFPASPPPSAHLFVLTLGGRAETHDAGMLQEYLHRDVLEREPRWNYAVNLKNLDYLSSTALRILVDLDMYKLEQLLIAGASSKLVRAMESIGISPDDQRGISFHSSIDQALLSAGVAHEAVQLCVTDEVRVGRDAKGFAKEADLVKWAFRERILGLQLAKELFRLERVYTEHFEKSPVLVLPSEPRYGVLMFKYLRRTLAEGGLFREIRREAEFLDEDDLEVVTKELIENALDHGYHGKTNGLLALETRALADRFEVAFTDFGEGYSPGLLRRLVGRGGLGLTRLQRMFSASSKGSNRRSLGILSPTSVDPAPLLELARRAYPEVTTWKVGPGTTIQLIRYR